jgi:hypothetical protein
MTVFLDVYFVRYPADPITRFSWIRDIDALRIAAESVGPDGVVHVPERMLGAHLAQAYMYRLAPHIDEPPFTIVIEAREYGCTFLDAEPFQLQRDVFILAPIFPWGIPPECDAVAHGLVEVGRVSYFSNKVAGFIVYRHQNGGSLLTG